MKAISGHFGSGKAAVRAVASGVDALLVCHTHEAQHEVVDALAGAVVDGVIPESRVREARRRLTDLAARHARSA
jgi:beta-N-acetylhexosaminidase